VKHDVVIVGGGHNGLVAATLAARAGRSVLVLERRGTLGGAAVSERPWPGVDARLSRYSYLVSLFPRALAAHLGLDLRVAPRRISSYTPAGSGGLLVDGADPERTRASMRGLAGAGGQAEAEAWEAFYATTAKVARAVFPTLTAPLPSRGEMRRLVADDAAWQALVERPLGEAIERTFSDDLVRGVVLTDALIGTFAPAGDPQLRQNRCFLYHVIGNGTGAWDVPVGGMGAVSGALERAARAAGAELRTGVEVTAVEADGRRAEVRDAAGGVHAAEAVLANVAPAVLDRLLGRAPAGPAPEGAQLKVNMLLDRLPRLRDARVRPEEAFAGTFHVNEGYAQLAAAHAAAAAGRLPDPLPCELYCHSLADPTILGPELRAAGAHTLTLFSLHTPPSLFAADPEGARRAATEAALRSLDSVLAEPVEDCLHRAPDGSPCLEARTPLDLEAELGLPGGNIFHRDLAWPWAEREEDVGRWGVETDVENVLLCGAGARRGGGVSGIPGHNAARALLERPTG
jgi:phytoene dehydrogenase-like protein